MSSVVVPIHNKGKRKPRIFFLDWRKTKKLTQEQIAGRIGTDKGTISRLETGAKRATDSWIFAYAEALGIEPDRLFRHPDAPTIDDLLRDASPELRESVLSLVSHLKKTGTDS